MFGLNFDFVAKPMGSLLYFIYDKITFGHYGIAIIVFTIFIRLILMYFTAKQYQSTEKMREIQPKVAEIQKMYKNDQQTQQQELMKLYSEAKYNPMSGCLPMLIQLPIIISLYYVIAQPLTYMLGMTNDQINALATQYGVTMNMTNITAQIEIIKQAAMQGNIIIDLNFLGFINLGDIPNWQNPNYLWIFPILSALMTYLSSKMTMTTTPQSSGNSSADAMTNSMTKSMTTVFPIMSGYFAFIFPAGLGLYWIVGYIFVIAQQWVMKNVLFKPKTEVQ